MSPKILLSTLLLVAVFVLVQGGDYGKVTCSGKTKIPNAKLIGTFLKAKCEIPKDTSDEALGKVTRCVYKYVGAYDDDKGSFDKAKAKSEMVPVFPTDYQAGLEKKLIACIDTHAKKCKNEKNDKDGKTWAGMYKCFSGWYESDLCTK